jgi:hypothetical protein
VPVAGPIGRIVGVTPRRLTPNTHDVVALVIVQVILVNGVDPGSAPPLLRLRVPPCGQGGRNDVSLPCTFLRGVPSTISGSLPLLWWPLSLLANASMLKMGSTLLLKMPLLAVPIVTSCPLLVGTLVDLIFGGPLLAQSAESFGSCTVFKRLTLATSSPLLSYESSVLTELIRRRPPPLWRLLDIIYLTT